MVEHLKKKVIKKRQAIAEDEKDLR